MKRVTLGLAAVTAGLLIAPNLASALPAVTTEPTNLRAGPAFDFPVVDRIPADVGVNVHGCVRGYRWCDVSWRDARGWVPGNELAYLDQGRRVTIIEYGPRIRLPVVAFSFDTYWDRNYRSRSWYGERARWRSVWREREGGERQSGDRVRDRREGRTESRTERRQIDRTDREDARRDVDRDRRTNRDERPSARTGRGDWRDRGGETRAYSPPDNPALRQGPDRGSRPDANPGRGRAEPSTRGTSPGGLERGRDGGGGAQGDRRP